MRIYSEGSANAYSIGGGRRLDDSSGRIFDGTDGDWQLSEACRSGGGTGLSR